MKNKLFIFIIFSTFVISCSNGNDINSKENNCSNNNSPELKTTVIERSLANTKYYFASNTTSSYHYYSFTKDRITSRAGSDGSKIVSMAVGDYNYLNDDLSEFQYKWDKTGGGPTSDKIILIDDDLLILTNGFTHNSNNCHILVKDVALYNDNTPSIGLGRLSKDNQDEWIVFSPNGKCYKRYFNLSKNDYVIVRGSWEKISTKKFKIIWDKKNNYDILNENRLYQNANDMDSVPIILYFTND